MPNAKVLSEKQAIVAELTEKIQKATAGVIVDYKGITVEEDTALRKECREGGVDYAVVKNTLLRFAFNNTGLNDLDDLLNGTTSCLLYTSSEVMYFLSGTGKVLYDGVWEPVAPGTCHYCPKGHSHSLVNDGTEDLVTFAVVPEHEKR